MLLTAAGLDGRMIDWEIGIPVMLVEFLIIVVVVHFTKKR